MTPPPDDPRAPRGRMRRDVPARHSAGRSASGHRVPLRTPDGPLSAQIQPLDRLPRRTVRRSRLARFMDQFGWRAYAIPVLAVASALCVSNIAGGASDPQHDHRSSAAVAPSSAAPSGPAPSSAAPSTPGRPSPSAPATSASGQSKAPEGQDTPQSQPTSGDQVNAAALPKGAPVPQQGNAQFDVVPGTSKVYGTGPVRHYAVEVEGGMSGVDAAQFAKDVEKTLGDSRSWTRSGVSLQRVDSGPIDFRVTLTSVLTIRNMCGYEIKVETSCYNGSQGRAFINVARWIRGAVAYGSDLAAYREYVVNHEVGHALGHGHMKCPKAGSPAPLMMEQTLGITTPGVGACRPNPWPYVDGKYVTGPATQGA
ncbi:MAG TPA: DUF3152 domain-containing protein [Mycobacteriales bacterium]|nr:DUF3152 domain-containing protein [Mycobacteriales bacterium]